METLAPEVSFERALDIYVREMGVADPLASVIATRALVALGDSLVPKHHEHDAEGGAVPLPRLRLDDASDDNRRRA